jgi:hypothetical protein
MSKISGYETEELRKAQIAALLKERAEAEAYGLREVVEAVDRSLAAFGQAPAKRSEKRPAAAPATEKRA